VRMQQFRCHVEHVAVLTALVSLSGDPKIPNLIKMVGKHEKKKNFFF